MVRILAFALKCEDPNFLTTFEDFFINKFNAFFQKKVDICAHHGLHDKNNSQQTNHSFKNENRFSKDLFFQRSIFPFQTMTKLWSEKNNRMPYMILKRPIKNI